VFRVIECGAGRGTLARSVVAAEPRCRPALEYVMVERSARLRADQPTGAPFTSRALLPDTAVPGVVLANELLDNLPFDLLEWREDRWKQLRVGLDASGSLAFVAAEDAAAPPAGAATVGARVPSQEHAGRWLVAAAATLTAGRLVAFDYADTTASMASRPWSDWVRTYRGHERGTSPLDAPGSQDITCEVAVDQLARVCPPYADRPQSEFLRAHGIDELVEEGRRAWVGRAHVGDLAALRARSRVREREALVDPAGLGAFRALEWVVAAGPHTPGRRAD
jgi:NADH dehydrogenase [ubiquinone] 1 alpha subcomplex assembly factor 7